MDRERLKDLLRNPTETLQSEIKSWLDLDAPDDRAKVARALLALRNRNGGQLIFGFDDKTQLPMAVGRPADLRSAFHADKIQELVKQFAWPTFPITLEFVERDGAEFPVIVIPGGVNFPVIASRAHVNVEGKTTLRQHAVYFRTVNNGRVESTEPRSPQDWEELLDICFDNREADVGRFMRRHLPGIIGELGLQPAEGKASVTAVTPRENAQVATTRPPLTVVEEGERRFGERVAYLRKHHPELKVPDQRARREVGIVLVGEVRPLVGQHLLHAIFPRHPQLSGWPLWIDSRSIGDLPEQPYPHDGGWEASILMENPAFVKGTMVDFWRIDPRGEFYHRRTLEDDLWANIPDEDRGTTFDIMNGVKRVAEALATVQAFAQGMLVAPDKATMQAAFLWTNLHGRHLYSLERGRDFHAPHPAYDDAPRAAIELPVATASGALAGYVAQAVTPLFASFGYQVPRAVIDELTAKTLNFNTR